MFWSMTSSGYSYLYRGGRRKMRRLLLTCGESSWLVTWFSKMFQWWVLIDFEWIAWYDYSHTFDYFIESKALIHSSLLQMCDEQIRKSCMKSPSNCQCLCKDDDFQDNHPPQKKRGRPKSSRIVSAPCNCRQKFCDTCNRCSRCDTCNNKKIRTYEYDEEWKYGKESKYLAQVILRKRSYASTTTPVK